MKTINVVVTQRQNKMYVGCTWDAKKTNSNVCDCVLCLTLLSNVQLMTSNSLAGGQLPCYFLVLNESCRSLCIIQSKAEHITRDTFGAPSDVVWWCLPPLTYFPFPSCLVLLHLHHATTQHGLCPYFWLTPGQAAIPPQPPPADYLPLHITNYHLLNYLAQGLTPTPIALFVMVVQVPHPAEQCTADDV